ncbi:MAG: valine--tRNA ligase, partial [Acidimicrobiia bacterium]|nr:valine--tRNA ligase [Acidimicrobiia bacterium]
VHPDDERYRELVGRSVVLPLADRQIPIVADAAVDPEFGTGAVKVTPAHDPNDFEIGNRHGLEAINIFTIEAEVNDNGGDFAGLDRMAARTAVKEALAEQGHIDHIEERAHSVGRCYRCSTIVEPYLSLQWFVKVGPLVVPAIEAVRDGRTRFVPQRWENSYFHWMENLRDWCVSRQIWWGHRIPAWYCADCDEVIVAREDPTACPSCGGSSLRQDEDVLDTWFSSALWPFSTLGWPDETADLADFYPNAVLVTGFDIIYFWVARMLKMGLEFMGDVPFVDVVIHGLVRSPDGRKMSKSLGNAIDPLDVIESHGADPLRLAIVQAAAPGQDVPFDMEWVEGARKFGNKLWNAARFVLGHVDAGSVPGTGGYPEDPGPESAWILSRLAEVVERFDELSDEYRFSDAYGLLYNFAWSEVFDWYLELSKAALADDASAAETRQTLGIVLRDLLKLFHPAIPYLTEELWNELVGEGLLAGSTWPDPPEVASPASMDVFQELVGGVRRFRSSHQLSPRQQLEVLIADPESAAEPWWERQLQSLVAVTARFGAAPDTDGFTRIVAGTVQGFIPLAGVVDLDAERDRLHRALATAEQDFGVADKKLSNPSFRDRAPAEIVAKEEQKRAEAEATLAKLRAQLDELGTP